MANRNTECNLYYGFAMSLIYNILRDKENNIEWIDKKELTFKIKNTYVAASILDFLKNDENLAKGIDFDFNEKDCSMIIKRTPYHHRVKYFYQIYFIMALYKAYLDKERKETGL